MSATREGGPRFVLATNNTQKVHELSRALAGCRIVTPRDLGLVHDPEERGDSFREIALSKAIDVLRLVGGRPDVDGVLADDSGLCVHALGGRPGVHSNRYGSEGGPLLSAEAKIELLLRELEGEADRRATFVCALVLVGAPDRICVLQEVVRGRITGRPTGTGGFGYDPVFEPEGIGRTMAELSPDEKDRLSHRGRAARLLGALLPTWG